MEKEITTPNYPKEIECKEFNTCRRKVNMSIRDLARSRGHSTVVSYKDYEVLKAEVKRLKKVNERLFNELNRLAGPKLT